MKRTIQEAVAAFGTAAKQKLSNIAAAGQPEDQLRGPFEQLLLDMAGFAGIDRRDIVAVGDPRLLISRRAPTTLSPFATPSSGLLK